MATKKVAVPIKPNEARTMYTSVWIDVEDCFATAGDNVSNNRFYCIVVDEKN